MNESTDGYAGAQQVLRDTTGKSGGTHGHVNCATCTRTIAGANVSAFEWNVLAVLDNHALEGENVALYAQANKHASGPTWAACFEACDKTPGDTTGLVGVEVDCWVSGPDNGHRIGVDVVVGDSRLHRGLTASEQSTASVGVRIGASTMAPHASWTTGIALHGNMQTGIDCTQSSAKTAIKLRAGQGITVGGINLIWLIYGSLGMSAMGLINGWL